MADENHARETAQTKRALANLVRDAARLAASLEHEAANFVVIRRDVEGPLANAARWAGAAARAAGAAFEAFIARSEAPHLCTEPVEPIPDRDPATRDPPRPYWLRDLPREIMLHILALNATPGGPVVLNAVEMAALRQRSDTELRERVFAKWQGK